jgi:hypothetical protein
MSSIRVRAGAFLRRRVSAAMAQTTSQNNEFESLGSAEEGYLGTTSSRATSTLSGVECRLTGPGSKPGIQGVTALRHWSPEEEEPSDGTRLMGCCEMQREIDGSRLTIPTN